MSLALYLKSVENLRGRGDRVVKMQFRGQCRALLVYM